MVVNSNPMFATEVAANLLLSDAATCSIMMNYIIIALDKAFFFQPKSIYIFLIS